MGSNPVNLGIRFVLEITAIIQFGLWGWKQGNEATKFVFAMGLPILAAAVWGIFNVPGDPSRSGNAPVVTPGIVRLIIELAFFVFAAWTFYNLDQQLTAIIFFIIVIVHYAFSYDRILWLIHNSTKH